MSDRELEGKPDTYIWYYKDHWRKYWTLRAEFYQEIARDGDDPDTEWDVDVWRHDIWDTLAKLSENEVKPIWTGTIMAQGEMPPELDAVLQAMQNDFFCAFIGMARYAKEQKP